MKDLFKSWFYITAQVGSFNIYVVIFVLIMEILSQIITCNMLYKFFLFAF